MAVEDVHWVLSHVVDCLLCIPAKHPHDPNGDLMKPDSKRSVLLSHLIYKV